jgi:hypothetical protein
MKWCAWGKGGTRRSIPGGIDGFRTARCWSGSTMHTMSCVIIVSPKSLGRDDKRKVSVWTAKSPEITEITIALNVFGREFPQTSKENS